MLAALALTLFTTAGSVTPEPPTSISATMVEIVIADPALSTELCGSYVELNASINALSGSDSATSTMFVDMADAYIIVTMEDTANMRLDSGARQTFINWLHTSCVV